MRHWYALLTKPRQERLAAEHLTRQQFEVYLPMGRERKLTKAGYSWCVVPLFPRYLFVNLDLSADNAAPIRSTTGCCGLVRCGMRVPHLHVALIEALRGRTDDQGSIPLQRHEPWQPGQRLNVTAGPFAGLEAIYQARSGPERAIVLLRWLGAVRPVEVQESILMSLAA